jgi:Ca2+-transporting ATPase
MTKTWFSQSVSDVTSRLGTDDTEGLSMKEVWERRARDGKNIFLAPEKRSVLSLFLAQFKNALLLLLLGGVIVSFLLGHTTEGVTIGVIVAFSVLLGFMQEFRAEKSMEMLTKLTSPRATVIRDGQEQDIDASDIVVGDLLVLDTGSKIAADGRVVESISLHTNEAPLTGESIPVSKITDSIAGHSVNIADQRNMVFAGTVVTHGRGIAIVTETGLKTEFGAIAVLLKKVERAVTPLQKSLAQLGTLLAWSALGIILLITIIGVVRGELLFDVLLFALALAVAAVPEALPAVVTISLALGVQRLARSHVLVRQLPSVETLGSTTIICTDKTGTLTKDEMTVRQIWTHMGTVHVSGSGYIPEGEFSSSQDDPSMSLLQELLVAGVLASNARLLKEETEWDITGDPTEGALVVAAAKMGLLKEELDERFPRTAEEPFSSERKRMAVLHAKADGSSRLLVKGALEVILPACIHLRTEEGMVALDDQLRAQIAQEAEAMAQEALRVIVLAERDSNNLQDESSNLTFLGMVGMLDPPRPEVKDAVRHAKRAGIRVIMITGDHPVTAQAIAQELHLDDQRTGILTGKDLQAMDEKALQEALKHTSVIARVSPEHKLRIITALQAEGQVVAMTGDGVNDAPALKKADIGIAMGRTGTDVSREAAAMTLTDDNFASIVSAISEGRAIFANIRKYLLYLLSSNAGEILLITAATILGLPLPVTAVQILFVNLATDGLPALALAVDTAESDLMKRAPRKSSRTILTRSSVSLLLFGGVWSMIANLSLFAWLLASGAPLDEARGMVFILLIIIQLINAYIFRSDHEPVTRGFLSNRWLHLAVLSQILVLGFLLYVPLLQEIFHTVPPTQNEWLVILLCAFSIVPVLELLKWSQRERGKQ